MNRLAFLLIAATSQLAFGQQDRFRFPEGPASWTVTCETKGKSENSQMPSPEGEPSRQLKLKKVEVSQTNDAKRSVLFWSDGWRKEVWGSPKSSVIVTEEPSGGTIATRNDKLFGDPYSPSSLTWIKDATLTSEKTVRYQEKDCLHYKGFVVENVMTGEKANDVKQVKIPCEAWIDVQSLLPVAIVQGDSLGKFTYGAPPESLEMPDKFRKRLEYYKLTMGVP